MDYNTKTLKHNPNISHEHPLKEFSSLLIAALLLLLIGYLLLNFLAKKALSHITPEDEALLFQNWQPPLSHLNTSPEGIKKTQQLQQRINQLKTCAGIQSDIQLNIDDIAEKNAFAFPGGKIVVYSGLLNAITSENSLTFILAHELAHISQRDHLRGLGQGLSLVALSLLINGSNSELSSLTNSILSFSQAQYSQQQEQQADAKALDTLQCFYGHVGGATDFFKTLLLSEQSNILNHFFSTHPELNLRIQHIQQLSQQHDYPIKELEQ